MLSHVFSRLKATLFPAVREARLRDDIEDHLAALTDAHIAGGLPEREARLAALRDFGSVEGMKERYRDQARFRFVEDLARDLRFAFRQCRKAPGFTALAIASLALGIGANTALFSFVNAILLQRLPVPDPRQLVAVALPANRSVLSYAQIDELDRNATLLDGIFGRHPIDVSVATGDRPRWVAAELVTGDYFRTLRIQAARGRLLTRADLDNASGDPACVISYRFWQDQLDADPNVAGRKLRINMRDYRVAGVTERGFTGAELQHPVDLQLPATRLMDFMPAFVGIAHFDWKSRLSMFSAMGRLRPGVNSTSAESELTRLNEAYAKNQHLIGQNKITLLSAEGGVATGNSLSQPAIILLAVSALVLLIACANLATLLIARTTSRSSEFAVRLAIGCSRRRVIAQVLTENALLAAFGTAIGVAIAYLIEYAILRYLNRTNPAIHQLHIAPDPAVLWFAIGVSVACVLLFGAAPAVQAARTAALGSSTGNTKPGALIRKVFVAVQIALSLVVLFSAGLLTRTLSSLETIDLGYRPDEIAVVDVRPAAGGYAGQQADAFYSQLIQRVRALPGIKFAATTIGVTLNDPFSEKLYPQPNSAPLVSNIYAVSPGYFDTTARTSWKAAISTTLTNPFSRPPSSSTLISQRLISAVKMIRSAASSPRSPAKRAS